MLTYLCWNRHPLRRSPPNAPFLKDEFMKYLTGILLSALLATGAWADADGSVKKLCVDANAECVKKPRQSSILQGTFEAALSINSAFYRVRTLVLISEAQAASGATSDALKTASTALEAALSIEDAYGRSEALVLVSEAQAASGATSDALKTASMALEAALRIEDASDRSGALASVSEAQAASGATSDALKTASMALEAALRIEDAYYRSGALVLVSKAQAASGATSDALETAFKALEASLTIEEDDFERAWALAAILKARPQD